MQTAEVLATAEERDSVGQYKRLSVRQYAARVQRKPAEGRYWSSFKSPSAVLLGGPVTYVEASPVAPYTLACTASTRVTLLDANTRQPKKVMSRHKDVAYSASWKPDGKLIVAGGESKLVQVFDTNSRSILRSLRGHEKAVHLTRYAPDGVHLFSASDDCSVKWWDVAAGECVNTFQVCLTLYLLSATSKRSLYHYPVRQKGCELCSYFCVSHLIRRAILIMSALEV